MAEETKNNNTEVTDKKKPQAKRPRRKRANELRPMEFLFMQIYDTNSNNVLGYDADLVINDKKIGTLTYDRISSVASHSQLAYRVGKWQIEEVCELINRQKVYGKNINSVFVTLTGKYLSKADFYTEFTKILAKNEIPHNCFGIQINEAELMAANDMLLENIRLLREGGAKICIIDFGSETTSLRKLASLQVDYVKLNREFTGDVADNERSAGVVEGIIELCEKLDVIVIADGIDTKEQLNEMKRMRCFLIEGQYFSTPEREVSAF